MMDGMVDGSIFEFDPHHIDSEKPRQDDNQPIVYYKGFIAIAA